MLSLENIYSQAADKIILFNDFVHTHALHNTLIADHIGYKCSSTKHFEMLRALLEAHSEYVYQSIISERRIAVIKLKKSILTTCGPIYFLELSDQKPDHSQKDGFDHLECYPTSETVEMLATYLTEKQITIDKVVRPHHTTYDSSLSDNFKLRLEAEPLINKIVREEIKSV